MNNYFLEDLQNYDVFEGMTSISAVIKSIQETSSNRKIIKVIYDSEKAKQKAREIKYLGYKAQELGFELVSALPHHISNIASGETHGGFISICTKRSFPDLIVNNLTNGGYYALVDGIEDPYNFGYSIRSLYASGVDGIVLPKRNWLEFSGSVAKSSAGTSELANIFIADTYEAVKAFKEQGFQIVCAGIRDAVSIYDYDFCQPVLLIIGGEKRGISRKILDLADQSVRIDYGREFMGSLPSASAISVIAFEIAHQRSKK